jgi:DNA polymerase-3 subunit epsilon
VILFFDTETTGKYDFRAPLRASHQPYLVQIGAALLADSGRIVSTFSAIVKPDGWTIPAEAAAIHGITTEVAIGLGWDSIKAMAVFDSMRKRADLWVAHNHDFDAAVLNTQAARHNCDWDPLQSFCTMKTMTQVCQLPGPYGLKWPKLSEAYKHATGKDFVGAHDAMADVLGCIEVYRWMKTQGLTPCSKKAAA